MNPIIKWVGGKRQLIPKLLEKIPKALRQGEKFYGQYYEPFLGGGALLFSLTPASAVVNDINPQLYNLYTCVRDHPQEMLYYLWRLEYKSCDKEYYLDNRKYFNKLTVNKSEHNILAATYFIWLNRHCFNGLYRVNNKGQFNVPWNKAETQTFIDKENFLKVSEYLKNITILSEDFNTIFEDVSEGDFVFLDPPYDPVSETASFTKYAKEDFKEEDQRRVATLCNNLDAAGVKFIATNHDTALIRELYSKFTIESVSVKRNVSAKASSRTGTEVIIYNYEE